MEIKGASERAAMTCQAGDIQLYAPKTQPSPTKIIQAQPAIDAAKPIR